MDPNFMRGEINTKKAITKKQTKRLIMMGLLLQVNGLKGKCNFLNEIHNIILLRSSLYMTLWPWLHKGQCFEFLQTLLVTYNELDDMSHKAWNMYCNQVMVVNVQLI